MPPSRRRATTAAPSARATRAPSEPPEDRREAVVDLLAVLAYGELSAVLRLAADAQLAPTVSDRASLAGMAAAEHAHYRRLVARLEALGVDPEEAMAPFAAALDAFHESTAPSDFLEALIKAYVGDRLAADFYREVSVLLHDEESAALVREVLADLGHAEFAVEHLRAAIEADPSVSGRLALWARRLVGEALTQAQRVATDRDALSQLIGGPEDLAEVARMLGRITERHTERMASLGLSS